MTGYLRYFLMTWLVLGVMTALAVVAPSPALAEGELVRAIKNRDEFLADREKQKTRANWLARAKEFEAAAAAQTEKRYSSRALYLGADLYLTSGEKFKEKADYQRADKLARQSVRECPRCTHAPPAQLVSGEALVGLGQLDQADKQLMKVELSYPGSPQVAQARKLLAQVRGGPPPVPEGEMRARAETKKTETKKTETQKTGAAEKKVEPKGGAAKKPAQEDKPSRRAKVAEEPIPKAPKSRADGQAQVYHLTLVDQGSHTLVTAYLDKVTPYVYNLIPPTKAGGDFRAYADLKDAVIAPGVQSQLGAKSNLVRLVKMNQFKSDVVRLVLDLPEAHPYRPVFLDKPPRLVFQVAQEADQLPPAGTEAQPSPPEKPARQAGEKKSASSDKPAQTPPVKGPTDSLARQLGLKVKCVVIDPGHGGKDGGASGFGVREKDVVLRLARKIEARLEKRLGLTVHLTRNEDKFLTLERRTKIAKDKKADLFISLHANANALASVEGVETYVLNFATDRSAMAVAARENAQSDKSVAELQDVLQLIARNTKVAESRAMAQSLHKATLTALNKRHKVRDLGVKEAPFYVLVGTEVPSILVEIGFVTNGAEAKRLGEEAYLDLLADGLTKGLEGYIKSF